MFLRTPGAPVVRGTVKHRTEAPSPSPSYSCGVNRKPSLHTFSSQQKHTYTFRLIARCEALGWPFEMCHAALPLRPSCHPLLAQACDAIVAIAELGGAADGAAVRAQVAEALSNLREALTRAAALHESHTPHVLWRHRLSTRLAYELTQRRELVEMPLPAAQTPGAGVASKIRTAGEEIIEGFGGAGRRQKPAEIVAAEAFEAAATRSAAGGKVGGTPTSTCTTSTSTNTTGSGADNAGLAADPAAMQRWGGGLVTLLRLHGHSRCGGAVRRALGVVLDYLLHLTPAEDVMEAAPGAAAAADALDEFPEELDGVSACMQPLCGGAGLAAHADLIACMHDTSGAFVRLAALSTFGGDAAALRAGMPPPPRPEEARSAAMAAATALQGLSSAERLGREVLSYACNVEVFSLMLHQGYMERRVGTRLWTDCFAAMTAGIADATAADVVALSIRCVRDGGGKVRDAALG